MLKKNIIYYLVVTKIFFCIFCSFFQNLCYSTNKRMHVQDRHQKSISQMFCYQIYGSIVCIIDAQKIVGKFIWTQQNKNFYNIKLFDIFGLNLISIYVEDGVISVSSNIIRQNNNFGHEIQKWFISNHCSLDQLQQWIIGSPGYDTEYNLNSVGCLSCLNFHCRNEYIMIHYRSYYTNSVPILPKIIEVYYGKNYIGLTINRWNIQ